MEEQEQLPRRYATKATCDSLCKKLGWRDDEGWMQDWPLEISNEIVIADCLREYGLLTDEDEKYLLMEGMLYALDEITKATDFNHYGRQISTILQAEFRLHAPTVHYWTLYWCKPSEGFTITPLMQQIWDSHN